MRSSCRASQGVLLLALGMTACGGAARAPANSPAQQRDVQREAFEALYRARQDSARMRFTPADAGFIAGMIGHHAQALVMAGLAPSHTRNETMHTLAGRIINAQNDEIALMTQWLRDRGQPVPEVHISGTTLTLHGAEHAMHMPGMLTPAQLDELDKASGAEFDRLFVTYMIQHHKGAVKMVHDLFARDGAAQDEQVFKLASDIQVDQLTEIARMESMLTAMTGR